MTLPLQTAAGRSTHATFSALLNAMSRPGTVQALPEGHPLELLAAALLDLEVRVYTPDKVLLPTLTRTGAVFKQADDADYLFLTAWNADALSDIGRARVGTPADPHKSATLFLPAKFGEGKKLSWRGPGIPGERTVTLGGMDAALLDELLTLRREHRFPLGWDMIFVDGSVSGGQVIGLPRTTQILEVD